MGHRLKLRVDFDDTFLDGQERVGWLARAPCPVLGEAVKRLFWQGEDLRITACSQIDKLCRSFESKIF